MTAHSVFDETPDVPEYPTIPVLWLPPHQQWDTSLVRDCLGGYLVPPGYVFDYYEDRLPEWLTDGAVVVIAGRYDGAEEQLQEAISPLGWALCIITGDEESSFEFDRIDHPNVRFWIMDPRPNIDYPPGTRFLGSGYPPWLRRELYVHAAAPPTKRQWPWSYAGQVNHYRRRALVDRLAEGCGDGFCFPTPGFTQGLTPNEYAGLLAASKVIPCPSGRHTPESFRVFEALEAGCVPIIDELCPDYNPQGRFWPMIFGEGPWPFLTIEDWNELPKYLDTALEDWQARANRCFGWWQLHKRRMAGWLADDLTALGVAPERSLATDITVLIPTSPIPSHPSTEVIDETIASIRRWLPDCEILVMVDGVREEQADRHDDYQEYVRRLLWKCNHIWRRVVPIVCGEHLHQAAMTRRALDEVRTPLVLFAEHDTPLRPDLDIPWRGMADAICSGHVNVIRLHHEAGVHPEHRHLMVGDGPEDVCGVPLWRTLQFSARPHLASAAWYRQTLAAWFSPDARTMIEDRLYGVIDAAREREGNMAWPLFRVALFAPEGDMRRSEHSDGRKGDPKWEASFVY